MALVRVRPWQMPWITKRTLQSEEVSVGGWVCPYRLRVKDNLK